MKREGMNQTLLEQRLVNKKPPLQGGQKGGGGGPQQEGPQGQGGRD